MLALFARNIPSRLCRPSFASLLRKSQGGIGWRRNNTPKPPHAVGVTLLAGWRASVVPDPVGWHRPRNAVAPDIRLPQLDAIFIIPGAHKRHERLRETGSHRRVSPAMIVRDEEVTSRVAI